MSIFVPFPLCNITPVLQITFVISSYHICKFQVNHLLLFFWGVGRHLFFCFVFFFIFFSYISIKSVLTLPDVQMLSLSDASNLLFINPFLLAL